MRLDGKTALVTGASSGIGAATARLLAARGARVFTAQRRTAGFEDIEADLMDPDAPAKIINFVKAIGTNLHILVNNAGLARAGTVEDTSLEDWHAQVHLNLTVPFLLTRHAMPLLRASQGAIVNVGSVEGLASSPRHPAAGASKSGLYGLTRAVAADHSPDGVRCNAVAPGWINTPPGEEVSGTLPGPQALSAQTGDAAPVGPAGDPTDVAELICWLASDAARFVTGQVWTIDGGRMARQCQR